MSSKARFVLIALWPVLVLALLVAARAAGATASGEEGERLRTALSWLAGLGGLYLVSFATAWFTRASWTAALIRTLLWAVAAFVCVNGIAGMFTEHRDLLDRVIGSQTGPEAAALRWRLGCWLVGLGLAGTAIGVGFEPRADAAGEEPEAGDGG
jgi:ATP/ADP translocase